MSYRTLGHSGLQVSTLTLGSMMFGEQTDTETSLRIIDKAWDQGINFIDTADVYTGGRSEEIVGEAIARHRHEWILATKAGFGPGGRQAEPQRPEPQTSVQCHRSQSRPPGHRLPGHLLPATAKTTAPPLEVTISAIGDLPAPGQDPPLGPVQLSRLADCRSDPRGRAPGGGTSR